MRWSREKIKRRRVNNQVWRNQNRPINQSINQSIERTNAQWNVESTKQLKFNSENRPDDGIETELLIRSLARSLNQSIESMHNSITNLPGKWKFRVPQNGEIKKGWRNQSASLSLVICSPITGPSSVVNCFSQKLQGSGPKQKRWSNQNGRQSSSNQQKSPVISDDSSLPVVHLQLTWANFSRLSRLCGVAWTNIDPFINRIAPRSLFPTTR